MATLLYVDDQAAIARAVKLWLSRKGHVVHVASTVADARAMVTTESLDGVFIDLWLGAESGLELYDWIEALDPELASRVAFVTGDLFDETLAARPMKRPVLAKPFELPELDSLASRWHAERASHEGRRRSVAEPRPQPGQ